MAVRDRQFSSAEIETHRPVGTIVLGRDDLGRLLDEDSLIAAVRRSLIEQAAGRSLGPTSLALKAEGGIFHVKAGGLRLARTYVAAKINANFPENPASRGLPTIQGVVGLFDGGDGRLLALMDSIEITARRTAAMSAIAATHLARPDSAAIAIIGCGVQGRHHLRSMKRVMPLETAIAFDRVAGLAAEFAAELGRELGIEIRIAGSAAEAAQFADICVTCTTSCEAILGRDNVRPGTFLAAVGADNPEKQEMEPELMAAGTVVVDLIEQCAVSGDLHHAVEAGAMRRTDVHAELAEIVQGTKAGRRSESEITIFDSSGTALQDVAAAAAAYENALQSGIGQWIRL